MWVHHDGSHTGRRLPSNLITMTFPRRRVRHSTLSYESINKYPVPSKCLGLAPYQKYTDQLTPLVDMSGS